MTIHVSGPIVRRRYRTGGGQARRAQARRDSTLGSVFRGRDAVAAGVLSKDDLRGSGVRRLFRGVYVWAGEPITHELRCEAAGLLLPAGGAITGRSMATLLGVELASTWDDVEVVLPEGVRWCSTRGIAQRRAVRDERDRPWRTTFLAAPQRMGFDLSSRVPKPVGVAWLDAVARGGLLDRDEQLVWLLDVHDPYVVAARAATVLCDPRSESVQESKVRVHLVDAGLDVEPGQWVYDAHGDAVARVDLMVRRWKVAIEYDGVWHSLREVLEHDRRRLRTLRDHGWEVVHVTAEMMRDPQGIVDAVARAITRQQLILG